LWELYKLNDDYNDEKPFKKFGNATTHCFNALEELGIMKTKKVGKQRLFAKLPDPINQITLYYCELTNTKATKKYIRETRTRIMELIKSPDFKPNKTITEANNLFGNSNFDNVIKTLVIQSRDFSIDFLDYTKKKEKHKLNTLKRKRNSKGVFL